MKIEVWSDVVCPWCYIGKRRFEEALEQFDGDVEVEWKSFELDPSAPEQPKLPLDEALAKKYRVSIDQARSMMDGVTENARKAGLDFDFSQAKSGNTFDAHRLLHLAKSKGLGDEMKERLLRGYFMDGVPLYDHDALATLATEVGLDPDDAAAVLAGDAFAEDVRDDEMRARQLRVTGVPFFLIDGKFGIPGAQTSDVFLQVLQQASAASTPQGEVCGPDGCA